MRETDLLVEEHQRVHREEERVGRIELPAGHPALNCLHQSRAAEGTCITVHYNRIRATRTLNGNLNTVQHTNTLVELTLDTLLTLNASRGEKD